MFVLDKLYSKKDIYRILDVPEDKQGGNWDTGYTQYEGAYYIFVNIGVAGRTGHDHKNTMLNDTLYWSGKKGSHIGQPTIKRMIDGVTVVHFFTREESENPYFLYRGVGVPKEVLDKSPVVIHWGFENKDIVPYVEEELQNTTSYYEGTHKQITVNAYERNPKARKACIKHYGCKCTVCGFDFEKRYGELGADFIHVHHIKPLHEIQRTYTVDPVKDLRPVCPNCHAMIHKRETPYAIEEIKALLRDV